jgi:hypothetical protein
MVEYLVLLVALITEENTLESKRKNKSMCLENGFLKKRSCDSGLTSVSNE